MRCERPMLEIICSRELDFLFLTADDSLGQLMGRFGRWLLVHVGAGVHGKDVLQSCREVLELAVDTGDTLIVFA